MVELLDVCVTDIPIDQFPNKSDLVVVIEKGDWYSGCEVICVNDDVVGFTCANEDTGAFIDENDDTGELIDANADSGVLIDANDDTFDPNEDIVDVTDPNKDCEGVKEDWKPGYVNDSLTLFGHPELDVNVLFEKSP